MWLQGLARPLGGDSLGTQCAHHEGINLSTTRCRAVARQVRAAAPLLARHAGKAVLAGLTVPSDALSPLTGNPA